MKNDLAKNTYVDKPARGQVENVEPTSGQYIEDLATLKKTIRPELFLLLLRRTIERRYSGILSRLGSAKKLQGQTDIWRK